MFGIRVARKWMSKVWRSSCTVLGHNGSEQNGMDKMVYGQNGNEQNGNGQNGMDKMVYGQNGNEQNGMDKMVRMPIHSFIHSFWPFL